MILRVFPRVTAYTPDDRLVRIGFPRGRPLHGITEVQVSCTFTWDIEVCRELAKQWRSFLPGCPRVRMGGPALDDPGGPFHPGKYVCHGISISSRGCPNQCPWCFVPKREGRLRLLPICPGNIVQDNNVTAWPREHFKRLVKMLRGQYGVRFIGGLEARRFRSWHVDALRDLDPCHIKEIWFAADDDSGLKSLRRAAKLIRPMFTHYSQGGRRKLRCYVMIGYEETLEQARNRLETVWDMGFLPFAQLYRAFGVPNSAKWRETYAMDWRRLEREWARPAAMFANHPCKGR